MEAADVGTSAAETPPDDGRERDGIMGLFRKSRARHARHARKPSWAERRAAQRTARAEAKLVQTEQRIHELADEARSDLKDPKPAG
jgi:hypothetical protein